MDCDADSDGSVNFTQVLTSLASLAVPRVNLDNDLLASGMMRDLYNKRKHKQRRAEKRRTLRRAQSRAGEHLESSIARDIEDDDDDDDDVSVCDSTPSRTPRTTPTSSPHSHVRSIPQGVSGDVEDAADQLKRWERTEV